MSSQHAKIYLKNTNYILQDLRSTNGTIMNNKTVKDTVYIKKGDVIKIGTSTFKVIG